MLTAAASQWTSNQNKVHFIAKIARNMGLSEDNPIIKEAQFLWWCELLESRMMAKAAWGESRYCTDRHQQLFCVTVYNRVKDEYFPNSVYEVLIQKNQYSREYTYDLPDYFSADEEMQRCFRNAYAAYCGEVECPNNVIYASEFPNLGSGWYEVIYVCTESGYESTTYFSFK